MTVDIGREVAALNRLSIARLRERYAEAFGESPASSNRAWLAHQVAWRLQGPSRGRFVRAGPAAELGGDTGLRCISRGPSVRG